MPAKSKIDDTRANDLYTDGLTDLQMAECLGVTRAAVQAWRKRNGLSINKAAYPPIEMEEQMENATVIQPVPVDLPETDKTLLRIQKLLSLRCDEDSRCIKNLFSELAVAMLRTGLEDKPERKEEKDDG